MICDLLLWGAAAYIGQLAGRSEPVIVELFRLARLGALHEEQLPKPRARTDGSLDRVRS